jgi:glycosyltransferase involved in cell wall biosynthesis
MLEDLKISIIIPCYNVSKYLQKCLESVADQTYSNLEIICINDGSTDNTLEILLNFESKDSRFKIYDQKNQGLSKTRSLGITMLQVIIPYL